MSFLFATSHLPETARIKGILRGAARPPEEDEDEEEEPATQPAPRSGSVRALSHLPDPVRAQADSDGPLSTRPAIPVGRPRPPAVPEEDTNHDYAPDTDHTPEPDSALHDAPETDTGPHEPEDSSPWYAPRITAKDLPPQGHRDDEDEPDHDSSFDETPPAGRSAAHPDFHDPDAPSEEAPTQQDRPARPQGLQFERHDSPAASFTQQQGRGASGPFSPQSLKGSPRVMAAQQQVRAAAPPAQGGKPSAKPPAAGPAQNAPAAPPPKQGQPPAPQNAANAGQSAAKQTASQQQMKIDAGNPQFEAAARAALADEAANSPTAAALQKEASRLGIEIVPQKGLAMSETKLVDGKPVIHFNPNPLMKTDTTMSHEITHAIQTAAYQQFINDAIKGGKEINQSVLDAATKAGQDAVAKIVPVHSIKDTPNDRRENEAMRMANVVNAERTASEMKNLPEDQKTVEEFQRRQTAKEKARGEPEKGRKHPNNANPMPEGTERGNYSNQYIRDTLGLDEKGKKKPKPPPVQPPPKPPIQVPPPQPFL